MAQERATTDEQDREMVKMYRGGMLAVEIAKVFRVSNTLVSRKLRQQGVKVKRLGRIPKKDPAIPVEEMADMYLSGHPVREVADKAKVSPSLTRRLILDHGVKMRTIADAVYLAKQSQTGESNGSRNQ